MVDRGHGYRRSAIFVIKAMGAARVAKRLFGMLSFSREDAVFYDRGHVRQWRKVQQALHPSLLSSAPNLILIA